VSQVALAELLKEKGWPEELADLVADAVGCHHGERISPHKLYLLAGNRKAMGDKGWAEARHSVFEGLLETFNPKETPTKETLSGPDFMLLAGLTSFADWIGSNEEYFPFGLPEECCDYWQIGQWMRLAGRRECH
jgi:CRISPR-associated endonuclease/helicase Cas3